MKKKKKVESACQKTGTSQSHNIYSFQMCNTFMKISSNMHDRKKRHQPVTFSQVQCGENSWKCVKGDEINSDLSKPASQHS